MRIAPFEGKAFTLSTTISAVVETLRSNRTWVSLDRFTAGWLTIRAATRIIRYTPYRFLPRRVRPTLRVPPNIRIRTGPLRVALHHIRREELPRQRIIIPRIEVIQPRHTIGLLTREADAGGQRAGTVA